MSTQPGLNASALDWKKVAALGVAFAVSGNFSGWNYGLGVGGWGGMLAAALAMAILYCCLTLCLAELAAAFPQGAGFDSYTREALGPSWALMCGVAMAAALSMASGLVVTFTSAYLASLLHLHGWALKVGPFAIVIAVQLRGAKETALVTMLAGGASVVVLVVFCLFMAPSFHAANLFGLDYQAQGARALLTHGWGGAWKCVPFAVVLYLGVEQVAQAASETSDPRVTIPKALAVAIGIVIPLGLLVLILATAGVGGEALSNTDDPLFTATSANAGRFGSGFVAQAVGFGAVISLFATLFALTYAGSRQIFYLAQAGALPRIVAFTNRRRVPVAALALLAAIGLAAVLFSADAVLVVFIFLISVAYLLVFISFAVLRFRQPHLERPFRVLGGPLFATVGTVLTVLVMISCYRQQPVTLDYIIVSLGLLLGGHGMQKRWQLLNTRRTDPERTLPS